MKLHTNDSAALVELWMGIKNYVPAKDQQPCAEQFIANVDDAGLVDISMSSSELYGVCDTFDRALRAYIEENGYDLSYDEDTDWEE